MNTNSKIFGKINQEVRDFKNDEVPIADGYEFNQKERIHQNTRYYNSRFAKGEIDSEGFRKFFYNIVKNPCNSATKAISFEPKDIMIAPAAGQSSLKAWIMDLDFRHWVKENEFSSLLGEIFHDLPIHGSVVLKKVGDKLEKVDLRNLINEQSADSLKQASYVIEQHFYSPSEFRKVAEGWENKEEVLRNFQHNDDRYIRVFERYGELPESYIEEGGDPDKYVYSRFIAYVPETGTKKGKPSISSSTGYSTGGIKLNAVKIDPEKEFPYREIHMEKIPGRWLGVGRIEVLEDPQIRTNEIINLRVKSSYITSLNLWQSRDDNFKKNLLKEVENGDVITAMDRIERVPTEDRDLSAFDLEERKWKQNINENTYNYDIARGQRPPAGTPLGAAKMAANMIDSHFQQIQKRVARKIKKILYEDIIPNFKKEKEHFVKLAGNDLEKLRKLITETETNKRILEHVKEKNVVPTVEEKLAIKKKVEESIKTDTLRIPENFYDDLKYDIDIIITGEERDIRLQSSNISMILQNIQQDPELLTDPAKRKLLSKLLETIGMDIHDIAPEPSAEQEMTRQVEQKQRGGGVSAQSMPQSLTASPGENLTV